LSETIVMLTGSLFQCTQVVVMHSYKPVSAASAYNWLTITCVSMVVYQSFVWKSAAQLHFCMCGMSSCYWRQCGGLIIKWASELPQSVQHYKLVRGLPWS